MSDIPEKQHAVQLVGPDELRFNTEKEVFQPGPYQVLGKVETTGLCFSDLKLLKQFTGHVRKGPVVDGIDGTVLAEIPSYVPDETPAVPGHETVICVAAMGEEVKGIDIGARYLLQTDYRWLPTASSNAAFGYNFEGGLQEYVLMDTRAVTSPDGESMLIPASTDFAASAIALVEPWACVEDSYVVEERQALKKGGRLLVVTCAGADDSATLEYVKGSETVTFCACKDIDGLEGEVFDDIIFVGADADAVEKVFSLLASHGLLNIVQGDKTFGRDITMPVGRTHYGGIRVAGTTGIDPADGYAVIPATGEMREGDVVDIVGAAGPMGTMHVIRNICQGVPGITVYGGDMDVKRLDVLSAIVKPLAEKNGVKYESYTPPEGSPSEPVTYSALMVPVPALVAAAVKSTAGGGIINIFAGIPATVDHPIDLDVYIAKKLYFVATSGSTLEDMKLVLEKVQSGRLDTNLSVAAIAGLDGAIDGVRAVEARSIPGKIMVYPSCAGLGLTLLSELEGKMPDVAAALDDGAWTKEAESILLKTFGQ
jgi:threonine dehydrogenase-like Zn-dependent dehydrogenase